MIKIIPLFPITLISGVSI